MTVSPAIVRGKQACPGHLILGNVSSWMLWNLDERSRADTCSCLLSPWDSDRNCPNSQISLQLRINWELRDPLAEGAAELLVPKGAWLSRINYGKHLVRFLWQFCTCRSFSQSLALTRSPLQAQPLPVIKDGTCVTVCTVSGMLGSMIHESELEINQRE